MPRRPSSSAQESADSVRLGALASEELQQPFPDIQLPIRPPYPPADARSVSEIPEGPGWLYEPKWDGFRCLAFRNGDEVLLHSKAGQPLGRYFPELVAALAELPHKRFVLDGEIVISSGEQLSFDNLLLRIHPAESRIRKLSKEIPATMLCFDLLVDSQGKLLVTLPLGERRQKLEHFFKPLTATDKIRLSPEPQNSNRLRAGCATWPPWVSTESLPNVLTSPIALVNAVPW